jgi:HNH endonuclease
VSMTQTVLLPSTTTPVGVFLTSRSLACPTSVMWERPVGEMAFERYPLPTLIGQRGMGKVVAAAAAAIALAPFSVLATTPGVAQAAPAQTTQVVQPSPPAVSTIPVVAALEEPTRPWWSFGLHYGVLVIAACFVAWMIHRFAKMWSAPLMDSAPWPARRGFGQGGIAGVLRARKRLALVEAGHRCAIPTCRHPTTEIAHIVPESESHDDSFENLIALCPKCQNKEIDAQSMRMYKHNLEILNSRYSDFERRVFDQIAETDRRSFIVEAGLEISLLRAVNDGLLRRVELAPVAIEQGEPTHYRYEVTDEGLEFVNRYVCGEDVS